MKYTKESLQNTWGIVESKEHAEFIIELAEVNGFNVVKPKKESLGWFSFWDNKFGFFEYEISASQCGCKQITIPLPPKAKTGKPDLSKLPIHFDCVCNKCGGKCCIGNCDEWPKVGGEVVLVSMGMTTFNKPVLITYIGDGVGCYKDLSNDNEYTFAFRETVFSKPKTPEQDLREFLHLLWRENNEDFDDFADIAVLHLKKKG